MPILLLTSGRARRVIVVEKHPAPAGVAGVALAAAQLSDHSEVRLGDGFRPLAPGEVQSASLTGLGARTIRAILERAGPEGTGEGLPPTLVLQPNDSAEPLRRWAAGHGFHLRGEALVQGFWRYAVLHLQRAVGQDPAYAGLPRELALRFGPHLLRARDPLLQAELERQAARLTPLASPGRPQVQADLRLVRAALRLLGG